MMRRRDKQSSCPDLVRASTSCFSHCIKDVDGIGTRACPNSARLSVASRVNPTCDDKPGHDDVDGSRPKTFGMRRREFIMLLGGAPFAWPLASHAQSRDTPVVGWLSGRTAAADALLMPAFRQA